MKNEFLIYALLFLFISCQCKPETFRFTNSEEEFIPYELDQVIRFQNLETNDIIEFSVVNDTTELYEETNSGGQFLKFCSGNSDDSFERRTFTLESDTCIMEYSITTEGSPVGISFTIQSCDISSFGSTLNDELPLFGNGDYTLNGILYSPVYELENTVGETLITPQLGVFTFRDDNTWQQYVLLD